MSAVVLIHLVPKRELNVNAHAHELFDDQLIYRVYRCLHLQRDTEHDVFPDIPSCGNKDAAQRND